MNGSECYDTKKQYFNYLIGEDTLDHQYDDTIHDLVCRSYISRLYILAASVTYNSRACAKPVQANVRIAVHAIFVLTWSDSVWMNLCEFVKLLQN
jgi:hypothetical protein